MKIYGSDRYQVSGEAVNLMEIQELKERVLQLENDLIACKGAKLVEKDRAENFRERLKHCEHTIEQTRQQLEFIASLSTDGQIFAAAAERKLAAFQTEEVIA